VVYWGDWLFERKDVVDLRSTCKYLEELFKMK